MATTQSSKSAGSKASASKKGEAKSTSGKSGGSKSASEKAPASKSAKKESKPKAASASKSGKASSRAEDAVTLLMADHRKVEDLFEQYEASKEDSKAKQAIFNQIQTELKVHMVLEEEIFYPASREFIDEPDTVNEAEVEHASCKDLIAQLNEMSPEDAYYDAKVKVLSEFIEHHVEEEEGEYFPELRDSEMDLVAVGEQLKTRKAELTGARTN